MKAPAITHFQSRTRPQGWRTFRSRTERRRGDRRTRRFNGFPCSGDADPRDLDEALADCEVLLLPAGTPLLRAGETNRNVFILLSGKLIAQLGEDASPDTAIEISPGECIGELSAIDGKPISALVLAVSDVRVLRLDREVFWNRLMLLRGVAENLMTTLTERMRRANGRPSHCSASGSSSIISRRNSKSRASSRPACCRCSGRCFRGVRTSRYAVSWSPPRKSAGTCSMHSSSTAARCSSASATFRATASRPRCSWSG